MDDYAYQEDLAVYSFGQEDDLGALLADSDEALDALTFGLDDDQGNDDTFGQGVGKDFDFAGSTSAFLSTTGAQQAGLKPAAASGWLDPAGAATTPAARSLSPWTSLDDDPLLGRGGGGALPPPVPVAPPVQQQQQQQKAFKTLEEVEAEMRAQRATAPVAPAPPAQAKSLEEVEAELLRQRQQQAASAAAPVAPSPAVQPSPAPHPAQPPTQPHPSLPPLPPQALSAFPPGFPPPLAAAYLALGIPPNYPPHMLPPHVRAQLAVLAPPPGAPPPQQPGAFQQGHSRPGSLAGVGMQPQLVQGSPAPSPALRRQQLPPQQGGGFPQPPSGPPTPGPGFPPLGAPAPPGAGASKPDLMATLFPPLPSQRGQPQAPPSVATVEQQLHYLSLNQHQQHPSLTGAQLQALLQQAHAQSAAVGGEKEGEGAGQEEEEKKRAAEELVKKVEERIMEHERMEEMRKRKAGKIAAMAKHNNLMSNSDKDFITRIQVSQLVTDDPYADDFYFHIMAAIKASRGLPVPGQPMGPPGPGAGMGVGGGVGQGQGGGQRRNRGRENAMNRMAQNVQRLVDSAKKRNAQGGVGGAGGTLSLDGALGKIATRTRSAPRPLLQVKPSSTSVTGGASPAISSTNVPTTSGSPDLSATAGAKKQGPSTGQSLLKGAGLITTNNVPSSSSAAAATSSTASGVPLSHRASLTIIETLYDCVLDLEQLRRIQPQLHAAAQGLQAQLEGMTVEGEMKEQLVARVENAREAVREGEMRVQELTERLWREMRVMEPLDGCTPHPFISLLSVQKGKRILPRAIRHLSPEQTLTLLTLIVATFDTLDVVIDSPILDQLPSASSASNATKRKQVEEKTEALLAALVPPVMAVVGQAPLRMVTGMLGLLMDRNDISRVVRSKPGLAFLTILLSRAEGIKQAHLAAAAGGEAAQQQQVEADLAQWHRTFTHLFAVLSSPSPSTSGYSAPLLALFPSTRLIASLPFGFLASSSSLSTSSLGALQLRPESDGDDEPVWRFLAALAVCADPEQQQQLVMGVREKVVENVRAARAVEGGKVKGVAAEVAGAKIRNVNLLLHALSLDASMIETDDE